MQATRQAGRRGRVRLTATGLATCASDIGTPATNVCRGSSSEVTGSEYVNASVGSTFEGAERAAALGIHTCESGEVSKAIFTFHLTDS